MKSNVVLAERTLRLAVGMLLFASPLLEMPTYPFNLLGVVLIGTALSGYCPLYGLLFSFRPEPITQPRPTREKRHDAVQAHPSAH